VEGGKFFEDFVECSQQAIGVFFGAESKAHAAFAGVVGRAIADEDAAPTHLFDEGLGVGFGGAYASEDEVGLAGPESDSAGDENTL
jgi:hypothetical protein